MQKKKSSFWLFICSLMPGAGHMYMGFMKMGISLMLGFMGLIAVADLTNLEILAIFPITLYIYSFFHANNLGTLNDEEFYSIKDRYLLGMEGLDSLETMRINVSRKYRKIAAAVLIMIGVIMLWNLCFDVLLDIFGWDNPYLAEISYFIRNRMPRAVIAVAVIWIGIGLIRGKKVDYIEEDRDIDGEQGVSGQQSSVTGRSVSDDRVEQVQQSVTAEQSVSDIQNNR